MLAAGPELTHAVHRQVALRQLAFQVEGAQGLAERQSLATDRRAIVVQITDKGRALMDEMAAEHMTWINDMFSGVSEADAVRGRSIMLDIRHGAENAGPSN